MREAAKHAGLVIFYQHNNYAFPGEESALNIGFAVPHDSTHVLAGYDTSPRGELMTSTLTAAMHGSEATSGHVLPVILSSSNLAWQATLAIVCHGESKRYRWRCCNRAGARNALRRVHET